MAFCYADRAMKAPLPADIVTLQQALVAAQRHAASVEIRADEAEARAANVDAINADLLARNALLELQNAKMQRALHGPRSERSARLIAQLELAFEDLDTDATEAERRAALAAAKTTTVAAFMRARTPRRDFPAHLPRERVVIAAPSHCACCGSDRLSKLGEDVTCTLERIPVSMKVIETVREKFSCRNCDRISQPPAPFHVTPRGMFGPQLLASILFEKFGQHQPLNRQRDRYALQGIELSLSTIVDQVGACASALRPLHMLIEAHVRAAERLHGDDTTVPVLARLKTDTGRIWAYVRDDRPFGGPAPPAALFHYSRDRGGEHPLAHLAGYSGILQADAYAGYNALFRPGHSPTPLVRALCWAHARRYFFELADVATTLKRRKKAIELSPLALEAVRRIDRVFDVEREINGTSIDNRLAVRREHTAPLVAELEAWMREHRAKLSRHDPVAKVMDYMLKDWAAFTRFLDDGKICLTNNAAERSLRGIAMGRKAWLFCGSDRGGQRAAFMYSLIVTAKLNDVDPEAWLADVLSRIAGIPQGRLNELLPWNWRRLREPQQPAAQAA